MKIALVSVATMLAAGWFFFLVVAPFDSGCGGRLG